MLKHRARPKIQKLKIKTKKRKPKNKFNKRTNFKAKIKNS